MRLYGYLVNVLGIDTLLRMNVSYLCVIIFMCYSLVCIFFSSLKPLIAINFLLTPFEWQLFNAKHMAIFTHANQLISLLLLLLPLNSKWYTQPSRRRKWDNVNKWDAPHSHTHTNSISNRSTFRCRWWKKQTMVSSEPTVRFECVFNDPIQFYLLITCAKCLFLNINDTNK